MQLIRCTKKLQKEMGLSANSLCNTPPENSFLGPWHANLIYIDRKKCVLFINDRTLFNFIIPDLLRDQIRNLDAFFKSYLQCVLASANFPDWFCAKAQVELETISYGNTNSKSILGSMNDLAFHYKYYILSEGGVNSPAVPAIIQQLNRIPMGALEKVFPIKALWAVHDSATK
jgi:hypothetical protein